MSGVDDDVRQIFSPLYRWEDRRGSGTVSQHRADPKNDMPRWLSVTLSLTIFNTRWQAVGNIEEISLLLPPALEKKEEKTWQRMCLIVIVNTSC